MSVKGLHGAKLFTKVSNTPAFIDTPLLLPKRLKAGNGNCLRHVLQSGSLYLSLFTSRLSTCFTQAHTSHNERKHCGVDSPLYAVNAIG